jgi:hypothetical protein
MHVKPWNRDVLDIPITFYVHMSALTETPEASVVEVNAHAILAKQKKGSTTWHIQCLDWESDSCQFTYQSVSERAIKITVLRGLILKATQMGIDPNSIRGWNRWASGWHLSRELQQMGME